MFWEAIGNFVRTIRKYTLLRLFRVANIYKTNEMVAPKTGNTRMPEEIVGYIQEEILGTSAEFATKYMLSQKFDVLRREFADYSYSVIGNDGKKTKHVIRGVNYMRCSRRSMSGLVRVITIIGLILDEDDKVCQIIGSQEFVGP